MATVLWRNHGRASSGVKRARSHWVGVAVGCAVHVVPSGDEKRDAAEAFAQSRPPSAQRSVANEVGGLNAICVQASPVSL